MSEVWVGLAASPGAVLVITKLPRGLRRSTFCQSCQVPEEADCDVAEMCGATIDSCGRGFPDLQTRPSPLKPCATRLLHKVRPCSQHDMNVQMLLVPCSSSGVASRRGTLASRTVERASKHQVRFLSLPCSMAQLHSQVGQAPLFPHVGARGTVTKLLPSSFLVVFSTWSLTATSAPEALPNYSVLRRLAFPVAASSRTTLQLKCAVSARGAVMAQQSMRLPASAPLAKCRHLRRHVQIQRLLVLLGWQHCCG